MKKNKSRMVIVAITATLTFGTLFAIKGNMYRHYWQHRSEQCSSDWNHHHENNAHFKKENNEASDFTDK